MVLSFWVWLVLVVWRLRGFLIWFSNLLFGGGSSGLCWIGCLCDMVAAEFWWFVLSAVGFVLAMSWWCWLYR